MKTIDELWYGNVSPFEQCTRGDKRLKEGLSHQLHSKSETVGEGIALGDAVHLIHAFLELFKRFLLLVGKRSIQFLSIPGYQLQ